MYLFKSEPQPAYQLYPVDRGWKVARYVWENTFSRTATEAESWYKLAREHGERASKESEPVPKYFRGCVAAGLYLAGAAQYIAAYFFVGLFIVVQVVILSLWFTGVVAMIGALAIYTKLYSIYYRAYYRCPGCHKAMDVPVFLCTCGAEHTRLWPSLYGVLRHICQPCGRSLATTEWNGRRDIDRRCAHCSRPLNADIGLLTNIHIPVVGGPFAGKSNLIVGAVHELIQRSAATGVIQTLFPDPVHERDFKANVARLDGGRELAKTTEIVPQAYNLSIRTSGNSCGKVVYVYDAAGEAYASEGQSLQQIYFKYVHGLIFVVDPFSIADLRHELGAKIDDVRMTLRPSPIGVMESYERMVTVLETNLGLVRGKPYPHPISVVVTKVDALDLESRIGEPAALALVASDPKVVDKSSAIDRLVRQFLGRYGLENFVRDVDRQFTSVRYFSCSALGRMPGTSVDRFVPLRALDPLESILTRVGVLDSKAADALKASETQPV